MDSRTVLTSFSVASRPVTTLSGGLSCSSWTSRRNRTLFCAPTRKRSGTWPGYQAARCWLTGRLRRSLQVAGSTAITCPATAGRSNSLGTVGKRSAPHPAPGRVNAYQRCASRQRHAGRHRHPGHEGATPFWRCSPSIGSVLSSCLTTAPRSTGSPVSGTSSGAGQARRRVMSAQVAAIYTAEVHTVTPETSLEHVMRMMTEHRIRHAPVVADGACEGS